MEEYRNMVLVKESTRKINFGEIGRRQWKFGREKKKTNVHKTQALTSSIVHEKL